MQGKWVICGEMRDLNGQRRTSGGDAGGQRQGQRERQQGRTLNGGCVGDQRRRRRSGGASGQRRRRGQDADGGGVGCQRRRRKGGGKQPVTAAQETSSGNPRSTPRKSDILPRKEQAKTKEQTREPPALLRASTGSTAERQGQP